MRPWCHPKNEWQGLLVNHEYARMLKNGVWEVVDRSNVPQGSDIIELAQ